MLCARVCDRVPISSCTRMSTSVRFSPPRALHFCVRLYRANPLGLPIVLLVLAPQGFVLLRTSVRCASQWPLCSTSLQRLFASVYCTSSKSFVRCEPTKALYSVRQGLCFCVLYEPQDLCAVRAYKGFVFLCTVRAPRALRGVSLQRLCASVCCTSPTGFFQCEPTKTLYSVRQGLCFCVLYEPRELCAVRAYKGFIQCALYEPHELCAVRAYKGFIECAGVRPPSFAPSAYVPVRSYEQMSSCTRTCTYALVHMYCTSSHVICGSVREHICLYVAERSIHVELVSLRVFCEHPQSITIYCNRYCS